MQTLGGAIITTRSARHDMALMRVLTTIKSSKARGALANCPEAVP